MSIITPPVYVVEQPPIDMQHEPDLSDASIYDVGAYIEYRIADILHMFHIRDNCTSDAVKVMHERIHSMFHDLYDRKGIRSFKVIEIAGDIRGLSCTSHYEIKENSDTTGHRTEIPWYIPTPDTQDYSAFDRAMKGV